MQFDFQFIKKNGACPMLHVGDIKMSRALTYVEYRYLK
jgi:hypothetical protein